MPRPGREGRAGLRFLLLFACLTVAMFVALYAAQHTLIAEINRHFAWASGAVMAALGTRVVSAGPIVTAGSFAVEIKNNCNAVYEAGLLAAALWAYPASTRAKALGTLVGISVLYAVNLLRLVSLLGLGLLARDWFEIVHLYVWQAVFFSVVAACWFGWIVRLPRRA